MLITPLNLEYQINLIHSQPKSRSRENQLLEFNQTSTRNQTEQGKKTQNIRENTNHSNSNHIVEKNIKLQSMNSKNY